MVRVKIQFTDFERPSIHSTVLRCTGDDWSLVNHGPNIQPRGTDVQCLFQSQLDTRQRSRGVVERAGEVFTSGNRSVIGQLFEP